MSKANFLISLFIILLAASCDFLSSSKKNVRYLLIGEPELELSQERVEQQKIEEEENQQLKKISEDSKTPSSKDQVYQLLEAYRNNADPTFAQRILEIIQQNPKDFDAIDTKLISALQSLLFYVQDGNSESIKFLFSLYQKLSGENKDELEEILTSGFIFSPSEFITIYFTDFNDDNCQLATSIPKNSTDKRGYLNQRKQAIEAVEWPSNIETFVSKCLNNIGQKMAQL